MTNAQKWWIEEFNEEFGTSLLEIKGFGTARRLFNFISKVESETIKRCQEKIEGLEDSKQRNKDYNDGLSDAVDVISK